MRTRSAVWIAWERHRRSRELARILGAELLELTSTRRRPWKYVVLVGQTAAAIVRRQPAVVFVQCPSVFLGVLVAALRPVLGFVLVLDLHNECVEPFNYLGRLYLRLIRWMWRASDVCIVTNPALAGVIGSAARHVAVLPDRIPGIQEVAGGEPAADPPLAVFVCTFAPDEPYADVIAAAARLEGIEVHVTGNPSKATLPATLPGNVRIRGYLPDTEYERLLCQATAIVDLTALENCLVCGAYEAVALEKPLVTSDTAALRAYFRRGTIYSRHTPEALAAAIEEAVRRHRALTDEMRELKVTLLAEWDANRAGLEATVEALAGARVRQRSGAAV